MHTGKVPRPGRQDPAAAGVNVSSIMTREPLSVAGDTRLDDVLVLLEERGFRHLPVIDEGTLVGIVSDRDLLEATGWLPSRVHACRGPGVPQQLPKQVRDVMHSPVASIGSEAGIDTALGELLRRGIGCLAVVEDGELLGIVTRFDVLKAYASGRIGDRAHSGMDASVSDRMTDAPKTVTWSTPLGTAISLCRDEGVRHLPVLQEGELVGIVTDRDLRQALGRGRHEDMPVGNISAKPRTVAPGTALPEAARILIDHGFSALPVVDGDECIGIITVTDILEQCLETLRGRDDAAAGPRID